ncbi:MAG TPA: hypothetical protein VGM07_05390 [Stellaceae bacterium]
MIHSGEQGRRLRTGLILGLGLLLAAGAARAQAPPSPAKVSPEMQAKIEALEPALENYVKKGMAAFDVPGAAVGIPSSSNPMTAPSSPRVWFPKDVLPPWRYRWARRRSGSPILPPMHGAACRGCA